MQVIKTKEYAEMSHVAGVIAEGLIRQKPNAVLGLRRALRHLVYTRIL